MSSENLKKILSRKEMMNIMAGSGSETNDHIHCCQINTNICGPGILLKKGDPIPTCSPGYELRRD